MATFCCGLRWQRGIKLSSVSCYGGTNPINQSAPSWPHLTLVTPQRTHLQMSSLGELRFSVRLWEWTNIQSLTVDKPYCHFFSWLTFRRCSLFKIYFIPVTYHFNHGETDQQQRFYMRSLILWNLNRKKCTFLSKSTQSQLSFFQFIACCHTWLLEKDRVSQHGKRYKYTYMLSECG